MARRTTKKAKFEDKDRISKLPDELIHHIMGFISIRFAVQTSVLSKRWKLIWTTLPFLNFDGYENHYSSKRLVFYSGLKDVFSRRNHEHRMLKLLLHHRQGLKIRRLEKYVKYAISHHVECLDVRSVLYCPLSMFNSNFLRELKLTMYFKSDYVMKPNRWTLPNLTTLFLKPCQSNSKHMFPISCLICLPALTTLVLDQCELPDFFSLPALKTLSLESCDLPENVWDFPSLVTLQLTNMSFREDMIESLPSLRNLTIDFDDRNIGCDISSSQLVNLNIRSPLKSVKKSDNVVVRAPNLCSFNAIGFFRTTFIGSELRKVNIKFWDETMYQRKRAPSWVLKRHKDLFQMMFSQLGSAEMLSLDLVTLQALSETPEILENLMSPFYKLKYLKLPSECEESILSSCVRQYLLGGSLSASIVKT